MPSADDFLAHAGWVRALARSLVGNENEADDVVQSAWLAALEKPPLLRVSPRAWLRSVVRHAVFQRSQRETQRKAVERTRPPREGSQPVDDVVQRAELHRKLVDQVMALDEPGRSTILMRYFDGLALKEIARRTGDPEGTVRARHHRALEQLRQRLSAAAPEGDWRVAVMPLAGLGVTAGATAGATGAGILVMAANAKLAVSVGALLVVAILGAVLAMREVGGAAAIAPTDEGRDRIPEAQREPSSSAVAKAPGESKPIEARRFRESDEVALEGKVRTEDGEPVPNARILAVPYNLGSAVDVGAKDNPAGWPRVVTTDPAGAFRVALRATAPAMIVLAESPEHAPRTTTIWLEQVRGPLEIVLEHGLSLSGTVQGLDRAPVPGARVSLRTVLGAVSVRRESVSDSDGRYRLAGLPKEAESSFSLLQARADGFAPLGSRFIADVDPEGRIVQDIFLTRGATIEGKAVHAETDQPISNARVVAWIGNDLPNLTRPDGASMRDPEETQALQEIRSRPDGTFTLEHVPSWGVHPVGPDSTCRENRRLGGIAAIVPGHAPGIQLLDVPLESSIVQVTLRCRPAARIRGRVVDSGGRPVAGARVWRSTQQDYDEDLAWVPEGAFAATPPREVSTDGDGRYAFPVVPSSTKAPIPVQISSHTTTWPPMTFGLVQLSITGTGDVEAPDLVLEPAFDRSAKLVVRTRDGTPVWGAAVIPMYGGVAGVTSPLARTDREGRALLAFRGRPENGGYRALVRAPGFGPAEIAVVPKKAEAVEVAVTLEPGHAISGVAVHPDGSPARGARVVVMDGKRTADDVFPDLENGLSSDWPKAYAVAAVGNDGAFEVGDLPPGPYHVGADLWNQDGCATATIPNLPAAVSGLRIVVPVATPSPRGRLVVLCTEKATGAPVLHAGVSARRGEAQLLGEPTAPGEYSFVALGPGEWVVEVQAPPFAPAQKKVEIEADGLVRAHLVLERGVTLRGRLLHPQRKPFRSPSAHVTGSERAITVADDGAFKVDGLLPGSKIGISMAERGGVLYVTRARDAIAIPSGEAEAVVDVPVCVAGTLLVNVSRDEPESGPLQRAERRELLRRSRIEVRDEEGQLAWDQSGVPEQVSFWLPEGRYTVRLEAPGVSKEQTVSISGSELAEATFELP